MGNPGTEVLVKEGIYWEGRLPVTGTLCLSLKKGSEQAQSPPRLSKEQTPPVTPTSHELEGQIIAVLEKKNNNRDWQPQPF